MNWKKMIVIGALACGAAGLVAGCGGEKKAAAPAADKSAKPTKIVAGMDAVSYTHLTLPTIA